MTMKPTKLKLAASRIRRGVGVPAKALEAQALLDALPYGEGVLTQDLSEMLGLRKASFQSNYAYLPALEDYRRRVGIYTIWAGRETIRDLKTGKIEL